MNNIQARIAEAIRTTREVVPGYFEKTVEQRLPGGCGSVLIGEFGGVSDVESALIGAEWEPFSHPAIMAGCEGFSTRSLKGHLGVVELTELPKDETVVLDDRKGTGKVSAVVRGVSGPVTDHIVIILGQEQGKEVVFTFHPGDPVRPSQVLMEPGMDGQEVSVEKALEMGLTTAKIAG